MQVSGVSTTFEPPLQEAICDVHSGGISRFTNSQPEVESTPVASDQRRKGRQSMSRRSGQKGSVCKKGRMWYVRFYEDVPGQQKRVRRGVPIGPWKGPGKLTKSEAERKASELIQSLGINTEEHFNRAVLPVMTFQQKVDWCRQYHQAWTDGRPDPIRAMESLLRKHVLPRFGDWPPDSITEERVLEFIADLKKKTFEKENGKPYKLSHSTIKHIVGVLKLVLGKKVWRQWEELDLGKGAKPKKRYFTEQQMQAIIEKAAGVHRMLFTVLANTGLRIGEAAALRVEDLDLNNCVIHVRRSFSQASSCLLPPKTEAGLRDVDIHPQLADALRDYLCGRNEGLVFQGRGGAHLRGGNIINRVLNPILDQLGIQRGGKVLHAFRHGRVTVLRKNETPGDLQKIWIGHSSLAVTDGYSHTDAELGYRREHAGKIGFSTIIGPNGPN
jgi:integrase